MANREDIARRHGIPHLAHKLVGETAEALEADAAARAALIQMFGGSKPESVESPEPAVEGLPPKDKPISDYTDEEWAASHAQFERTLREQGTREQREREEQAARDEAEATKTPEQRHAEQVASLLRQKGTRNAAIVQALHPEEEG